MLFALWMHMPKRENMVLMAAGIHLHTQQASRLSSKGRQKSVQDLGLQKTACYNANAWYKDFVQDRQKLSLSQILSSFNGEGKGRRA